MNSIMPSSSVLIITTANLIQGYRIKEHLGIVRGTAEESTWEPRRESSRTRFSDAGYPEEDRRDHWEKAHDGMRSNAERMKANAVIGVAYISYPKVSGDDLVTGTRVEILCYGTAVVVEPE